MFKKENLKQRYFNFGLVALALTILAIIFAFSSKNDDTKSYATKSESKMVTIDKAPKNNHAITKEESKEKAKSIASEPIPTVENSVAPTVTEEAPVVQQVSSVAYNPNNVVLSNGNTAGIVGSQAAAQMAAATGVPQSTWEHIIARESNGNPNAANASGASGLFQTMPGWGSTATVEDQVNAALKAYSAQGLSAWGY
ncbi:TPA: transglycosylase SLT domain-containing protein [Streptococcus pyogenes]